MIHWILWHLYRSHKSCSEFSFSNIFRLAQSFVRSINAYKTVLLNHNNEKMTKNTAEFHVKVKVRKLIILVYSRLAVLNVPSEVNEDALIDRLKTTFVYADFFRNNQEFFILKPIRILQNFEFEIFKNFIKNTFLSNWHW